MKIVRWLWNFVLAGTQVLTAFAQQQAPQQNDARGIYIEAARPAMRFNVLLDRDGRTSKVSSDYAFHTGDRMKFQFDVNKDLYVYVLHRTVDGEAGKVERYAGTRGIEVIRDEDRNDRKADSWALLFPNSRSGRDNLVRANVLTSIPAAADEFFLMDESPGMEKLTIVAAQHPLELEGYFDIATGKLRAASGDDTRIRLARFLMDYSGNSIADSATRGIEIVEKYAGSKDPAKPIVVVVDLRHVR